ncbi:MAG: PAS domain S-box protein [Methylomicrobium sp.]|nr:PAS domain S-box protein [Methylomicrobium sp.]
MDDLHSVRAISDQELSDRLALIQLSARDIELLKNLHVRLKDIRMDFLDDFYVQMLQFDETSKLLSDPEQVERLKTKQAVYFDRLIEGRYDHDYVKDRVQIGATHHRIGLKPQWYIGAYHFYLAWLLEQMQRAPLKEDKECYEVLLAVIKVILFDIELAIDAYFQADHDMLRLMAQVFESNVEGVLISDTRGRILHANRKVSSIAGYSHEELLRLPVTTLLAPQERDVFVDYWQDIKVGSPWQGETYLQKRDGKSFPAWVNVSAVMDDNNQVTHFVIEFSDISAYREAQEALQQRTEELARSNKELEQFAYVASHDLQEPLRMVASFTQLLARRYEGKLDADADEFIHYAVDGATRMQTLINDLLAYSRVGTRLKPFEAVSLEIVLQKALDNLRLAVEESGAEIVRPTLPTIMGDTVQLTQLFQNLIANAIKFRGEASPKINISVSCSDDFWRVELNDNGIGIEPEFFERIFVIFQRLHTKEDYPGTGIGLAICKKIVERHGGTISVESEPGQGATFIVILPKIKSEEVNQ